MSGQAKYIIYTYKIPRYILEVLNRKCGELSSTHQVISPYPLISSFFAVRSSSQSFLSIGEKRLVIFLLLEFLGLVLERRSCAAQENHRNDSGDEAGQRENLEIRVVVVEAVSILAPDSLGLVRGVGSLHVRTHEDVQDNVLRGVADDHGHRNDDGVKLLGGQVGRLGEHDDAEDVVAQTQEDDVHQQDDSARELFKLQAPLHVDRTPGAAHEKAGQREEVQPVERKVLAEEVADERRGHALDELVHFAEHVLRERVPAHEKRLVLDLRGTPTSFGERGDEPEHGEVNHGLRVREHPVHGAAKGLGESHALLSLEAWRRQTVRAMDEPCHDSSHASDTSSDGDSAVEVVRL
mmetsp:Transcript_4077/g.7518  ORF Transcript_4077/g.7518 Transcript_4077/m.7518 type:complete len:351 (+) Transcript_4077:294-1346(+)